MAAMTKKEREYASRVAELGCIICGGIASIHHAGTGAGGRKDHSKILPICYAHHQGHEGIHTLGRKAWQNRYGTETELLEKVRELL
jgi:hypothetical protein